MMGTPSVQSKNQSQSISSTGIRTRFLMPVIVLSLVATILSTLATQIAVQHYGPFVRTLQCYFNIKILQHDSWDIYQARKVVYWRTSQYHTLEGVTGLYRRVVHSIQEFQNDSFVSVDRNGTKIDGLAQVELLADFDTTKENSQFVFFRKDLAELSELMDQTMLNRHFYQHLKDTRLIVRIPIVQYQHFNVIIIQLKAKINDGLLVSVQLDVNPSALKMLNSQTKQSLSQTQDGLQIRKLTTYRKLGLEILYLKWIYLTINTLILVIQFWNLSIENQRSKISNKLAKKKLGERVKELGLPRISANLVTFMAIVSHLFNENDGLACWFCWLRVLVFLSFTDNPFMVGILFKRAIPTYAKILSNLAIVLTAFVLFSMVVYQSLIKFETIQLGYYQYIFNYFQYGIYQNFTALKKYGLLAQSMYFLQMLFIVIMVNNILQSILAGQVLKNSNLKDLTKMLQRIECQCPKCFASPRVRKTVEVKLSSNSRFASQFIEKHFKKAKKDDFYEIKILSPRLSPYFHSTSKKNSQKNNNRNKYYAQPIQSELSADYTMSQRSQKVIFEIGDDSLLQNKDRIGSKVRCCRQTIELLLKGHYIGRSLSIDEKLQKIEVLKQQLKRVQRFIEII